MSITAQFEFDEIEYRQALHEMLGPLRWTLPVGAIVLSVVALWLGVFRHWAEVSLGDAILTGLPWVLLGAFFLSLTPLLSRAKARKALELDPSLNGTQRHTVGDAGLQIRGAGYSPSLTWTDLERVTETKHFFLFFQDKRVWHYIPKRVLSDVERDEVRNLIQAHAPEMGRPLLAARAD